MKGQQETLDQLNVLLAEELTAINRISCMVKCAATGVMGNCMTWSKSGLFRK